jgi:hypothetical protein
MRDASDPLCLQAHLFIQHVWESRVKCRTSSHGSSCVGGRNRAAVLCYLIQIVLTRLACPVFLARQPCWTLPSLGWVHACQPRGPWHSQAHVKATSTASVSPLARQPCGTLLTSFVLGPCLLSTKDLDVAMLMLRFLLSLFSYWSPTYFKK